MKTKHNDAGLIYMKELGFRPAKTIGGLFADIEKPLGKQYAEDFFATVQARAEGNSNDDEIYHIIHRCFKTSMTITSAYSADYYRKVCNWLFDNKDCIKGRVLDVGCGNGIITCFIASRFPECHVVGIDCVEDAIKVAQQLAKKLQLTNVEFITADIREYEPEEKFDTVFSSLTMASFITETFEEPSKYGYTKTFATVIREIQAAGDSFVSALSNLTKDGACFLQVERSNGALLLTGWTLSTKHHGFSEKVPKRSIYAIECAEEKCFNSWILQKTPPANDVSDEELIENWYKFMTHDEDISSGQVLIDNIAQAVLEYFPFEQDAGYIFQSDEFQPSPLFVAYGWLTCQETRHYVEYSGQYFENEFGEFELGRSLLIDGCTWEDGQKHLEEAKEMAKQNGYRIVPHYFGGMPGHCKTMM